MKPLETIGGEGRRRRRMDSSLSADANEKAKKREMEKRLRGEKNKGKAEGGEKGRKINFGEGWEKVRNSFNIQGVFDYAIAKKEFFRAHEDNPFIWKACEKGILRLGITDGLEYTHFNFYDGTDEETLFVSKDNVGWDVCDKGVVVEEKNGIFKSVSNT